LLPPVRQLQMTTFATRLRRLLDKKGWTAYRLAMTSDISKEGVSNISKVPVPPAMRKPTAQTGHQEKSMLCATM
ncbi:hypothetical protein Q8G40_30455, partial [Klebsiella pneumoniae]|uniref:hypothetical protein n=1 Tax=Klebsiella pneumoniae TaxID=573 RepID=UPI0030133453